MALILIVDDSETHRRELEAGLSVAGHQVLHAVDGVDGLEVLAKNPAIQVIICDVNMPRMNGLAMIEKARMMAGFDKTPVVMLTTEADPALKARGAAAGVRAWATKPFDTKKLLVAIERLIPGGPKTP